MIEVIGAGWGRTGTLTLKAALDELGFPCYHMTEVFSHAGHDDFWLQAADDLAAGRPVDLTGILSSYRAVTDWPTVSFWRQLLAANPSAKCVLTVREPDRWYESMKETVWAMSQVMSDLPWHVMRLCSLGRGVDLRAHLAMVKAVVWDGSLQGCFANDPAKAKRLYQQHIADVKQAVPPEQLLVYQVSEGWEPLCEFLGCPVPAKPFPHENDREAWRAKLAGVRRMRAAANGGLAAVLAGVAAAALMLVSCRPR